jgi:hypothetical protein
MALLNPRHSPLLATAHAPAAARHMATAIPADNPAQSQTQWLTAAALAALVGLWLWVFSSLAALPLLVYAWRELPRAWQRLALIQLAALWAAPDLAGGIVRYADLPLWAGMSVAMVGGTLGFAGFIVWGYEESANLVTRLARAAAAWVLAPLLLFPVVVLHPVQAWAAMTGLGFTGLLLGFGWVTWAATCRTIHASAAVYLVALGVSLAAPMPSAPDRLAGIDTRLGASAHDVAARINQLDRLTEVMTQARHPGRAIVLPEAVVADHDASFTLLAERMAKQGGEVWVGVDRRRGGGHYNSLVRMHPGVATPQPAPIHPLHLPVQEIDAWLPLPVATWRPWATSVTAFGPTPRVRIGETLSRVFFCYEAVSLAAWVRYLFDPPVQQVVWVANLWWAGDATRRVLHAGARGFAMANWRAALVTAVNR